MKVAFETSQPVSLGTRTCPPNPPKPGPKGRADAVEASKDAAMTIDECMLKSVKMLGPPGSIADLESR